MTNSFQAIASIILGSCIASTTLYAGAIKPGPTVTKKDLANAPSRSLHPTETEWAILHFAKQKVLLGAEWELFNTLPNKNQVSDLESQITTELEIRKQLNLQHIPLSLKNAVTEETTALNEFLNCLKTNPADRKKIEEQEKKVRHTANQTNIVLEQLGFPMARYMKICAEYVNELMIVTVAAMSEALSSFGFSEENIPTDPAIAIAVQRMATQIAIDSEKEKLKTFFNK